MLLYILGYIDFITNNNADYSNYIGDSVDCVHDICSKTKWIQR